MTDTKNLTKVFTFNPSNQSIRIEVINHQPWFVAKDVCQVLSISNHNDAVSRLDEDEKRGSLLPTPSGNQRFTVINESGLYNLIFQSRKPEAKVFRKWVTSEVLPSIRKTGKYEITHTKNRSHREGFNVETLRMLWLIDANLNHGDQTQIALELGVSLHAVQRTLRGTLRSSRILWACYQQAIDNSNNTENIYSNPGQVINTLSCKSLGGK
jgi:prophage antirepressor-like protein